MVVHTETVSPTSDAGSSPRGSTSPSGPTIATPSRSIHALRPPGSTPGCSSTSTAPTAVAASTSVTSPTRPGGPSGAPAPGPASPPLPPSSSPHAGQPSNRHATTASDLITLVTAPAGRPRRTPAAAPG